MCDIFNDVCISIFVSNNNIDCVNSLWDGKNRWDDFFTCSFAVSRDIFTRWRFDENRKHANCEWITKPLRPIRETRAPSNIRMVNDREWATGSCWENHFYESVFAHMEEGVYANWMRLLMSRNKRNDAQLHLEWEAERVIGKSIDFLCLS